MIRSLPHTLFVLAALLLFPVCVQGQITREQYIATYAPLAISQQKQYGIPASIKMAQGILESQCGNSELCRKSNNHFGIKCKSTWTGRTVSWDDDAKGECFRAYDSIEESYTDHSEFLKTRERYASLFKLKPTDYKGWAHGLKKAGYATNPDYAGMLIKIIEENDLHLLDKGKYPSYLANVKPVTGASAAPAASPVNVLRASPAELTVTIHKIGEHSVFLRKGSRCVIARAGDTYQAIAHQLGIPEKRLLKFNRKDAGATLSAGQVVYIEKASKKALKS